MYLNPPEHEFSIEESLLAGSRHTAVNTIDGITYVTTIMIIRLEPKPPIYQVAAAQFRETSPGEREYLSETLEHYTDLTDALTAVVDKHHGKA